MKLFTVLNKYYVMALIGSDMVGFDPDSTDTRMEIKFVVDGEVQFQYFNDQDIQLLDHPKGAFFVLDVDGKDCGFIALDGVTSEELSHD